MLQKQQCGFDILSLCILMPRPYYSEVTRLIWRVLMSWLPLPRSPGHQQPLHEQHHDDVIKCKHFTCYWLYVRGIRQSLVNSPHKGQWRGALMFSLIYAWTSGRANNRDACDLRRHHAHYGVTVMKESTPPCLPWGKTSTTWTTFVSRNDTNYIQGYFRTNIFRT